MKTKFLSYSYGNLPSGCKYCVRGEKLVLFVSGKCSRNCWYCSLSNLRKNKEITLANEREIKNEKELIQEAIESNATSAGITGGDPLLSINKTIKYASALKKRFGKKFHIHIYLPTKLLNKSSLRKLFKVVDEVRFHPEFLINTKEEVIKQDLKKIKMASEFWKRKNMGIEMPLLPNKKSVIIDFIEQIKDTIGFVNLNEFELSDTNFKKVTKDYKLNQTGYVITDSKKAGLEIINYCKKKKLKLNVHLCTADTKNWHQFQNRLKRHKIHPHGRKTPEGTVVYLCIYARNNLDWQKLKKEFKNKKVFLDGKKKRVILSPQLIKNQLNKHPITRVEEYPTFDSYEVESEIIQF